MRSKKQRSWRNYIRGGDCTMTDEDIRKEWNVFTQRILDANNSGDSVLQIRRELEAFCKQNNVTFEQQIRIIRKSEAGRILYKYYYRELYQQKYLDAFPPNALPKLNEEQKSLLKEITEIVYSIMEKKLF